MHNLSPQSWKWMVHFACHVHLLLTWSAVAMIRWQWYGNNRASAHRHTYIAVNIGQHKRNMEEDVYLLIPPVTVNRKR